MHFRILQATLALNMALHCKLVLHIQQCMKQSVALCITLHPNQWQNA